MFKTLIKIIIIFVVVAAVAYYSFNLVMSLFVHSKKEITLPDVKGKSIEAAVEELSLIGLSLMKEGEEFNNNVPPGVVLRQSPPAGMNVKTGKIVRVTTSRGGEMIYVPNLVGQTARAADINLKSASLIMGEVSKKYSITAAKGIVLAQDPAADSVADKGAVINIVISDGLPPEGVELMPDLRGKTLEEAKEIAKKLKLSIDVKSEETVKYLPNTVSRQIPSADTDLANVKKVTVYMAKKSSINEEIMFNYQMPDSGGNKKLRLLLIDENGEREIFDGVKNQGAVISLPIQVKGKSVIKVYINNSFFEEIEIQQ